MTDRNPKPKRIVARSKSYKKEIEEKFQNANLFFHGNHTKPYSFRLQQLKKLKQALQENQEMLAKALQADLHKSFFESYMAEVGIAIHELNHAIKNLKKWMRHKRVSTPFMHFHARSFIVPEPYGVVLLISPWNYPVQLTFSPLIGAIAAGNCVIIKPSEESPHVSKAIAQIIEKAFPLEYISVVEGGVPQAQELLQKKFDYIFFTGSPGVGKIIMKSAAEHLIPVTLELGGKSPCIVEQSADLKTAARRIAFGKFLNAGQTCVAPDYVLVDQQIKKKFIELLIQEIEKMFSTSEYRKKYFPKIISQRHFYRVQKLLVEQNIIYGGNKDRRQKIIEPTLIDEPDENSLLMQEEIFGPVLPIISYQKLDEAIEKIKSRPKPLALYLFANDKTIEQNILSQISYGGGCINDTIVHLSNFALPFGGVGNSGMGHYHGKYSFDTFSHMKSILKKYNWLDVPVRYHPYTLQKLKMIKKIIK